jgi:hypothetical protein
LIYKRFVRAATEEVNVFRYDAPQMSGRSVGRASGIEKTTLLAQKEPRPSNGDG